MTGSALHEPKGVFAAAAGQIYIADGAGSGDWTSPSEKTIGQGYVAGNAAATVIADIGSANAILVDFNSGVVEDTGVSNDTILSTNGRVTNDSGETKKFQCTFNIYGEISGGVPKVYTFLLGVNGTLNSNTLARVELSGSGPNHAVVTGVIELSDTQYVELYVYQVTATPVNITVDTCTIQVVEL
jgi:hypothetical protein